nr:MAG TPA: hypothetical protein [Caudoviricetes sp.]
MSNAKTRAQGLLPRNTTGKQGQRNGETSSPFLYRYRNKRKRK